MVDDPVPPVTIDPEDDIDFGPPPRTSVGKTRRTTREDAATDGGAHESRAATDGGDIDVEIVVFRKSKSDEPLSKVIQLVDGKPSSDSSQCRMVTGLCRRWPVKSLDDFASLINTKLTAQDAIALGAMNDGLGVSLGAKPIVVTAQRAAKDGFAPPNFITRTKENIAYRAGRPAFVLFDFDLKGQPADVKDRIAALGGLEPALASVMPELMQAGRVVRLSTSAGLYNADTGEEFPASGGMHIYVLVANGADATRFLTTFQKRLWLAGLGWHVVSRAGSLLERSPVDTAVSDGARLVFEGGPVVTPPLAQHPRPAVVFDGPPLDTLAACPPLTAAETSAFNRLLAESRKRLKPECAKQRKIFTKAYVANLIGRGVNPKAAREAATALATRQVLLPTAMLEFDDPSLGVVTVADVLADPKRFAGKTLRDPIEGHNDRANRAIVTHGGKKIFSHVHGGVIYTLGHDTATKRAGIETSADVSTVETESRAAHGKGKRVEPPTDLRSLEECILETLFAGLCDSEAAQNAHTIALDLVAQHATNCGLSDADISRLREVVTNFDSHLWRGVYLGGGWHCRDFFMLRKGLVGLGAKQKKGQDAWFRRHFPVCPRFTIEARMRDPHGDGWGLVISFADGDGVAKELLLSPGDINGPTPPLGVKLRDGGLCCAPKRVPQIIDYLTSVEPAITTRRRVVERGGWHTIDGSTVFVTPSGTIGDAGGERVILQGDGFNGFAASGTLDEWREHVAKPAGAHCLLRLAMATALSGSILALVGHQSGGVHLKGNSSLGKTTALAVAASIWGKGDTGGGFISQWNTTANALEGVAALLSDTVLILDEMSQAAPQDVAKIVMAFGNEAGKSRMRADTTLRRSKTWRAALLSSGNVGVADAVDEGNRKYRAATAVRLVEIDADAKRGYGIFDSLDATHASAAKQADALRQAAGKFYGTAGPALVAAIIERGRESVAAELHEIADAFVAKHVPPDASGQVHRVAMRLAAIAAAGELATRLGILPWEPGATEEACAWALRRWIGERGGVGDAEQRDALQQVRRLLQMYGESRFKDLLADSFRNEAGGCLEATTTTSGREQTQPIQWGLRKGKGSERSFLVWPEILEKELCAGFSSRAVARELKRLGYLKTSGVKNMRRCWKVDDQPYWGYEISASILGDAADADDDG